MSLYVTPDRYRALGIGFNLDDLQDFELRSILQRASAVVDAYCNVPLLPTRFDFRGGTIINEEHAWPIFNDPVTPPEGSRRFYFWHRPLRTVTDFNIYVTNQQYVHINPPELFINNSEGYVEVVALAVTSIGIFGSGIIPNVGLARPVARMSYTYGYSFTNTDDIMDATDGLTYRASAQFWDLPKPVTVKRNGTVITTGFTTDPVEGTVIFDSPNAAGDVISATYSYTLPTGIAEATALIASHYVTERAFARKGLAGIEEMRMNELEVRRPRRLRTGSGGAMEDQLFPEVAPLLSSFEYVTIR